MELRYYQTEAVDSIYGYFSKHNGNPIVAMPTGTGKSVVIGSFVKRALTDYKGTRIVKLTHVKELIEQNYTKLLQLWPLAPAGVYSAGLRRKEVAQVTFAGIASVAKRAREFGHVDLVLIDECHLLGPNDDTNYRSFLVDLLTVNPMLKVVGFTATPYRLGQGLLTSPVEKADKVIPPLFTDICYNITGMDSFNKLVDEGYLCTLIPKRTGTELDVSQVKLTGGEFNQGELQLAVDKSEITLRAVQEIISQGEGRAHWLIFATGVQHAEHVAETLRQFGVQAVAVHSQLEDPKARDKFIADFKSGRVRAVVNNNVLTTGFDFPGIDLIAVLRPTTSPGLWVQMLGRGTRPCEGKQNCLVLDFAGNTKRLGPINDPVIPRKRGKRGGGGAPVRICEKCGTYNHASVKVCINCGEVFPVNSKLAWEADTAELVVRPGRGPKIDIFRVTAVIYDVHHKADKPDSIRVTYQCGLRTFSEWVCLEHEGFAGKKARDWWRLRTNGGEPPATTAHGLLQTSALKTPTHLRVWWNAKVPQILGCDFTGTAFGTQQATIIEVEVTNAAQKFSVQENSDDDIPF